LADQELDTPEFQAALARILVDERARRVFSQEPERFRQEQGLTQAQLNALQVAGLERLTGFSHDLIDKRLSIFTRLCPGTLELLRRGDLMNVVAPRFISRFLPRTEHEYLNRTVRDFFWFATLLLEMLEAGELAYPYLEDVLRYEHAQAVLGTRPELSESLRLYQSLRQANPHPPREQILASRPRLGEHARLEIFTCDVGQVIRKLIEGEEPPQLPREPTPLLFVKASGARKAHAVRINRLTHDLVSLCTGQRTTREIISQLSQARAGAMTPSQLEDGCVETLLKMYGLFIVSFEQEWAV
jgi:hypothetical protein